MGNLYLHDSFIVNVKLLLSKKYIWTCREKIKIEKEKEATKNWYI